MGSTWTRWLALLLLISHPLLVRLEPYSEPSISLRFKPYAININTDSVQTTPSPRPTCILASQTGIVTLVNTGQSIQTTNDKINLANITGGPLPPGIFVRLYSEYFWTRNCGHEITGTTINGKGFCFEFRVVWKNNKYDTIAEAVRKPDGVVETVFVFETCSTGSSTFPPLSEKIQKLEKAGSSTKFKVSIQIKAVDFITPDSVYYSYFGSFLDTYTGLKYKCSTVMLIKPNSQYCITPQQLEETFRRIYDFKNKSISNTLPRDFSYVPVSQGDGIMQDSCTHNV